MMKHSIRRATIEDASAIISVHTNSILEICSEDYPAEQILPWSQFSNKESIWIQKIYRDYIWVLKVEGKIVGFAHLAVMTEVMGELMGLYLLKEVKGKGLGKELMKVVLDEAKAHNLILLSLLSTTTAKSFYQSFGAQAPEGPTQVEINGVSIKCHPMIINL